VQIVRQNLPTARLHILVRTALSKPMRDMGLSQARAGLPGSRPKLTLLLTDAATLLASEFHRHFMRADRKTPQPAVLRATLVSLESDKSFAFVRTGPWAHITGIKLPAETDVYWNQVMARRLFEYPIQSDQFRISRSIQGLHGWALRVVTVLRFSPASSDHVVRAFEFVGDPGIG